MTNKPAFTYSPRRAWALSKLWMALRDFPEVGALVVLVGGAYVGALHTLHRIYFTPAGESFPSAKVRRDPELQVAYGSVLREPSWWYRIARWNSDERGYRVGIFDNRGFPFEHNLPVPGTAHSNPQSETNVKAAPVVV
ncbi:hypothetical protein CHLRE_08g359950v5 [Chlamydomonas reinhardtii]|uniref:Uncharacterized protein n=1 Tax=Chlamydomonas reinhardtii TaxID=3055 RepID=A0A2K3DGE2_CHLRE|nr:uncharacterized protein CHLRE_08g359950v5 [Chlamydomonas reinhardtii]PNW79610.1 hypothetical protein CHLRE_08g359950v5 [Chlamydomonas reinhardtii]